MNERTTGLESLSRRELQIAREFASGHSYKAIAGRLNIAPATVRTHLGTIYRKLEVSSKIELANILRDTGRRRASVLAADVADYAARRAREGAALDRRIAEARAAVVDPEIARHGGRILVTSDDGLIAEFATARQAVTAARALHEALGAAPAGDGPRTRLRIGIDVGEIVYDGRSVRGDAVSVAARLETLAPPGGLCVSAAAKGEAGEMAGVAWTELPLQEVANLPLPVSAWRLDGGTAPAPPPAARARDAISLAVLPFDNLSSDPDQAFLADGIVEDITTELSRFRWLVVVARNSTLRFRGSDRDLREIADELGVRYVVKGSVRRGGDRLRVAAQLVEAATGLTVWADRWDKVMTDLFEVQDEVTSAILTGLSPEIGAHERRLSRQKPAEQVSAWELCQRAWAAFVTYTEEGFAEAAALFAAARAEDPDFDMADEMEARLRYMRVMSGRTADRDADIREGIALARRALSLNDRSDGACQSAGVFLAMLGRPDEAMGMFDRGLALNPNNPALHAMRAMCRLMGEDPDVAAVIADEEAALRLSPLDSGAPTAHAIKGVAHLVADAADGTGAAHAAFAAASALPEADWYCHFLLAISLVRRGNSSAAAAPLAAALALNPGLTLASMEDVWPFPAWRRLWPILRADAGDALADLGVAHGSAAGTAAELPSARVVT